MRLSVSLLSRTGAIMLGCLFVAAGAPDPGHQILGLETGRSLGKGALATLLASPDEAVAQRAALAVGRAADPAGTPLLVPYLHDSRAGVRAMSAYGLGLLATGAAAKQLTALVRDRSGAVRVAALDAVGRYEAAARFDPDAEAKAVRAVAWALRDRNPLVRGRAAITMNFFADGTQGEPAVEALTSALQSERVEGVRERIVWTMFRRFAIRVRREVLRGALRDPDEIVRVEAVRAYGRLKNEDAIGDLRPLLRDRSWRVQEQTSESILALEGKPTSTAWTAIPSFIHVPSPQPDPLSSQAPLPRLSGKLAAPTSDRADLGPPLVLDRAVDMLAPAHGPHPRLRIVTTKGDIYVVLYPEWAPMTVENFLNMMNAGFLDNNQWFRIVPDFVVQTGEQDPVNAPGPGYTVGAEENPLEQNSYVISMGLNYDDKTNQPIRDSAGSEYYITLSPQYHLNSAFTVFGAMSGGFDVLGRLVQSDRVVRVERIGDATL